MSMRRGALLVLIFVSTFSIFIASISDIISVDISALENNGTVNKIDFKKRLPRQTVIGNSSDHLLWFLQISDTHISIFHDPTRLSDLHKFCRLTIPAIKPAVVLASGDLTDAKAEDNMGSAQYEEEWISYRKVLDQCNFGNHTVWLDVRGNHDNFNIPDESSPWNYYNRYSQQGQKYPRSYLYQMSRGNTKYSFLAVDACLEPGPKRPFNFVGMVNQKEATHLRKLMQNIDESGSNFTIWFGHYPTSCILSHASNDVRTMIGSQPESLAYLCGHFHTFGGTMPHMYTLQKAGFLELELGDWKDNRLFRLLAIDHGLLSFIDLSHGEWPAILITNPKHALYQISGREPTYLMGVSSHVRILAFSLDSIVSVEVRFDEGEWSKAHLSSDPLYTLPWNPNTYGTGLHYIHVKAVDASGRTHTISQPFSLDGTRISFNVLPRFVLMSNISTVFQVFFGTTLFLCVVPLCIIKWMHSLVLTGKMKKPSFRNRFWHLWLKRFWVLASIDRIFYPLTLYALYITVGPWSVGAVIEGYTGVIFAWGIIINGAFLPGSFTYAYGFMQLLLFQVPLTLLLSCYLYKRFQWLIKIQKNPISRTYYWLCQTPFAILMALQLMFAYFFWLAYGTLAFFLGPLRTWSVVLSGVLWYQAFNLPEHCFNDVAEVYGIKRNSSKSTDNTEFAAINPSAN